jgi:hypothetical protein
MSANTPGADLRAWPLWQWPGWMTPWWLSPAAGQQGLTQSILPGWMLGNSITVNETNSSSPEAEREIVAAESYGRQLGRVIDALTVLINERPAGSAHQQALDDLIALSKKVDAIKSEVAVSRSRRIVADLAGLKQRNPDEYKKVLAELKAVIAEAP